MNVGSEMTPDARRDWWNGTVLVGTTVRYWTPNVSGSNPIVARTAGPAIVRGGKALVPVSGAVGDIEVDMSAVTPHGVSMNVGSVDFMRACMGGTKVVLSLMGKDERVPAEYREVLGYLMWDLDKLVDHIVALKEEEQE